MAANHQTRTAANTPVPKLRLCRRTVTLAIVALAPAALAAPSRADPYDDCILRHVRTSQDYAALQAIKNACISSTTVAVPPGEGELRVTDVQINGAGAFAVDLHNLSQFVVTELLVTITDKATHDSSWWRLSTHIERGGNLETEYLRNPSPAENFREKYTLAVTATKGIPLSAGWWSSWWSRE
jgi:hypothetical protein